MSGTVHYWLENEPRRNLGDYLSVLFVRRLAATPPDRYASTRLIGSVIVDFIIAQDLAGIPEGPEGLIGFWGCGLRDDRPLPEALARRCRFHGVRGPLTRDRLGLPPDTPLGDPALLLPLIHRPEAAATAGGTLLVPHIHDPSDHAVLLARTGAGAVLAPTVASRPAAMIAAINAIASAEFVLCGALHAAIIACAYGRPFAFVDTGHIDLPFKWFDFAASVGIPAVFVRTLAEGRLAWETLTGPALRRPPWLPMVNVFPGTLRPIWARLARKHDEDSARTR
jgi:hypothetical protein